MIQKTTIFEVYQGLICSVRYDQPKCLNLTLQIITTKLKNTIQIERGSLTLDIVNRYFVEDVPFRCNLDVYILQFKEGQLQKVLNSHNIYSIFNRATDSAIRFLSVGDADYDCDHRICIQIEALFIECDEIKVIANPFLIDDEINLEQGHFLLNTTLTEKLIDTKDKKVSELPLINFNVADSPVLIMEMLKKEYIGFTVEFPNQQLTVSMEDTIEKYEKKNINK
jgi:hypothetical protein